MKKIPPIRRVDRHATPQPPRQEPAQLTLDLILHALSRSIFHPFIACLLPLCLRALAASYSSTSFILTSIFAATICLYHILSLANHRIAYGAPRSINWHKEVVVVTGGGGGLGSCIAEIYGLRGVTVAVLDISSPQRSAGELEEEGIHYYHCDVSSPQSIIEAWIHIASTLGTPTILINNAGISTSRPFRSTHVEIIQEIFAVNTISHFHTTRTMLASLSPRQLKRGATIVTVSSVLGHLGAANLSAYTASKAALLAYHASLTAELAVTSPNVKTILVAPGQLDTQLFADMKAQGWLQRFVGPVVSAGELAMRIVEMVDRGESGEIRMPFYAASVAWVGVLPSAVKRWVRWWSGIDEAAGQPESSHATLVDDESEPSGDDSDVSDT